jgi:hypothetical protein
MLTLSPPTCLAATFLAACLASGAAQADAPCTAQQRATLKIAGRAPKDCVTSTRLVPGRIPTA